MAKDKKKKVRLECSAIIIIIKTIFSNAKLYFPAKIVSESFLNYGEIGENARMLLAFCSKLSCRIRIFAHVSNSNSNLSNINDRGN